MTSRGFVDLIDRLNDGDQVPFSQLPSSPADLALLLASVSSPAGRALVEARIAERKRHNQRRRDARKAALNG